MLGRVMLPQATRCFHSIPALGLYGRTGEVDKNRNLCLEGISEPVPDSTSPQSSPHSPVQQGMVQVLTQALQDLVMVPDSRGLILTGRKVALQLQESR